jgi:hypothetical protein
MTNADDEDASPGQHPTVVRFRILSFWKTLLFLLCLGLPWLINFLSLKLHNAVFWPQELLSPSAAQRLSFAADVTGGIAVWISFLSFPTLLTGLLVAARIRVRGRQWLCVALFCVSLFVSAVLSVRMVGQFRDTYFAWREHAFEMVVHRGQPIIDALEAYLKDKGQYPDSLHDLVPEYLEGIPTTGLAGYPEYQFRMLGQKTPYELFVQLDNSSPVNNDTPRFYYWPINREGFEYPKYHKLSPGVGEWEYCR